MVSLVKVVFSFLWGDKLHLTLYQCSPKWGTADLGYFPGGLPFGRDGHMWLERSDGSDLLLSCLMKECLDAYCAFVVRRCVL